MNTDQSPRTNTTGLPIPGTVPDLVATLINGLRTDPRTCMGVDMYAVAIEVGFPALDMSQEPSPTNSVEIQFDGPPNDHQLSAILTAFIAGHMTRAEPFKRIALGAYDGTYTLEMA